MPPLLETEFTSILELTEEVVVEAVKRLTAQGKLEYGPYVPPPVVAYVLRNPDTGEAITTRDQLNEFINADSRNMRRLLYPGGKKSVEAEQEINRLLTLRSTPNAEKEAARKQKEEADKWGIHRRGSDKTELDRPTKPKFYEDTVGNANRAAAEQERARLSIDRMIQNFSVSTPRGVDHAKTFEVRQRLRAIKFTRPDGRPDYPRMENEIGQAIRKYQ